MQILYVPGGISGSTVKAVSLGEESSESTLLHVVENNGSEWLNLHNMDDFVVLIKILLCPKCWTKERLSTMPDVAVSTAVPRHFSQPEEWNVTDTIFWLKSNSFDDIP